MAIYDYGSSECNGDDCTFMVAGPNVPRLGEITKESSLLDVAPTFLDILGVPIPSDFEGKSLIQK